MNTVDTRMGDIVQIETNMQTNKRKTNKTNTHGLNQTQTYYVSPVTRKWH